MAAILVVAVTAGLAVLCLVIALMGNTQPPDQLTIRLNALAEDGRASVTVSPLVSPRELLDQFTSALNSLISRSSYTGRLNDQLVRANLRLTPSDWRLCVGLV